MLNATKVTLGIIIKALLPYLIPMLAYVIAEEKPIILPTPLGIDVIASIRGTREPGTAAFLDPHPVLKVSKIFTLLAFWIRFLLALGDKIAKFSFLREICMLQYKG